MRYAFNNLGPSTANRRCFEFCAGPAFIGFTMLSMGVCRNLVLADVNPVSVEAARETVRRNGLEALVTVYHSDGLTHIPSAEHHSWHLVFSNPPHFVDTNLMRSGLTMTVDAGWALHSRFFREIGLFLVPGAGEVIMQENMMGSRPENFIPMLTGTPLHIVAIRPDEAISRGWKYWYEVAPPPTHPHPSVRPSIHPSTHPSHHPSHPPRYFHLTNDRSSWVSSTRANEETVSACDLSWAPAALRADTGKALRLNGDCAAFALRALVPSAAAEKRAVEPTLSGLHQHGYAVHSEPVLTPTAAASLRANLVSIMESETPCKTAFGVAGAAGSASGGACEVTDESAVPGHQSFRVWSLLREGSGSQGPRRHTRDLVEPLLRSPAIRHTMASLLGPDFQLNGATAYVASPGSERENVWHFDFNYQNPQFRLESGGKARFAAAMIFLQDTGPWNGGTMLVPGSHKWATLDPPFLPPGQVHRLADVQSSWRELNATTAAGFVGDDAPTATSVTASAGQVLFFRGDVLHATGSFGKGPSGAHATPAQAAGAAAGAEQFRYAVVLHFTTQEVAVTWGESALEARYLGGHSRLTQTVRIGDGGDSKVVFSAHDDLAAISHAFVRRHAESLCGQADPSTCVFRRGDPAFEAREKIYAELKRKVSTLPISQSEPPPKH